MKTIDKIYINGQFVTPHGREVIDLLNPTNNQLIGRVLLGNETDARMATSIRTRSRCKTGYSPKD